MVSIFQRVVCTDAPSLPARGATAWSAAGFAQIGGQVAVAPREGSDGLVGAKKLVCHVGIRRSPRGERRLGRSCSYCLSGRVTVAPREGSDGLVVLPPLEVGLEAYVAPREGSDGLVDPLTPESVDNIMSLPARGATAWSSNRWASLGPTPCRSPRGERRLGRSPRGERG